MAVPSIYALKRRPSQNPLPLEALAKPPLFKWAKLRSGGECKSCLVWVCELQRDFNDMHRVKNNSFLTFLNTSNIAQIFRNIKILPE